MTMVVTTTITTTAIVAGPTSAFRKLCLSKLGQTEVNHIWLSCYPYLVPAVHTFSTMAITFLPVRPLSNWPTNCGCCYSWTDVHSVIFYVSENFILLFNPLSLHWFCHTVNTLLIIQYIVYLVKKSGTHTYGNFIIRETSDILWPALITRANVVVINRVVIIKLLQFCCHIHLHL